jgi:hypothetical protein
LRPALSWDNWRDPETYNYARRILRNMKISDYSEDVEEPVREAFFQSVENVNLALFYVKCNKIASFS